MAIFTCDEISPIAARSISDLELDEKFYKPDLEITARFQAFSKEMVRISLLGLGVYGFLIKMAVDEPGQEHHFLHALREHQVIAAFGVAALAICAACALANGFLSAKCLGYQLTISRYFGRLEGERWDTEHKKSFKKIIEEQQKSQKSILRLGNYLLLAATIALIVGAAIVAVCSGLVLFGK